MGKMKAKFIESFDSLLESDVVKLCQAVLRLGREVDMLKQNHALPMNVESSLTYANDDAKGEADAMLKRLHR